MRPLVLLLLLFTTLPVWAELPFEEHGWSREEAAVHLLSRFTYGPRPGDVDEVVRMGPEAWLEQQLSGRVNDGELERRLAELPEAYTLGSEEVLAKYPRPGQIRRMAEKEGLLTEGERPDRRAVFQMLQEKGMHPFFELGNTLFAQKLLHARHSEHGLREVLTDFWFNHFNVSLSNNRCAPFILAYERDAIRPNALGSFRELLGATAKHPAMLLYLDNAGSSASKEAVSTADTRMDEMGMSPLRKERMQQRISKRKKGLNENYARELMELHTLGVDGGYTQEDVVEVARAFTGWTTAAGRPVRQFQGRKARMGEAIGIEMEGGFIFASPLHDAGSKRVLGYSFPAGGGREEGERVLDILTEHPSTAHHIARKLAVRFISDTPKESQVKEIAQSFLGSGGDMKQVMRTIAHSDGFWDRESRRAKVKSPFELVVSANRALGGELTPTRQLYGWMAKMGQPLYNYQAPTGFPDEADFWVSSATVLNRVNFALQAARGEVPGFSYSPGREGDVSKLLRSLLPHQAIEETRAQVEALLADSDNLQLERVTKFEARPNLGGGRNRLAGERMRLAPEETRTATTVGLILGTPEFQRR